MKENNTETKLLTYDQAQALAQALNMKSFEDWKEFYKSDKYEAKLIPLYPELAYKEWKGWEDFLNLNIQVTSQKVGRKKKDVLSYEEAKEFLKDKGLKYSDWKEYCKIKPSFIPSDPFNMYRNIGWVNWYDFLNYTKEIPLITDLKEAQSNPFNHKKRGAYLTYEKAKEYLKDKGLKHIDWKEYCKEIPSFIPKNPFNKYRNNGWVNWRDFLSYEKGGKNNGPYLTYEKAREYLKDKDLKLKDWKEYCKIKPSFIPKDPYGTYQNKGWNGWNDFLSYNFVTNYIPKEKNNFEKPAGLFPDFHCINFEGAKNWVEESKKEYPNLKLSKTIWKALKKPSHIPDHPDIVYKNKGWKEWDDFFGNASAIDQKNDAKKEKIITKNEISKEGFFKRLAKPFINLIKNETLIIEPKESTKEKKDKSLEEASQRLVEPYFPRKQKEEQKELQDEMNEKLKQQLKDMKDDALQIDSHLMRHEIDELAYPVAIEPELRTKLIKMFEHWSKFEPEKEKQLTKDLHDLLCRSPDNTKKEDEPTSKAPSYISEKGLKALLTLFDVKTYPEYMEFRNASPRKDEMPLIPHKHYNNWDGWMAFFNQQTEEKKVNVKVKSKPAKVNANVKKTEEIHTYQDMHPTVNYLEQLCAKLKKEFSKEEYHSGNTYYYVSYEEAKKFAHSLSLKSSDEWNIIREDLPHFIPHYPDMEYKEFESWETFLGYKPKPTQPILPTHKKEPKESVKPKEKLPPIKYIMNKDGTVSVLSKPPLKALEDIDKLAKEHFTQFEKAKELVKKFKFQNEHEYKAYLFKPKELPENPEQEFAKKGWVDWDDFLGLVKSEESSEES